MKKTIEKVKNKIVKIKWIWKKLSRPENEHEESTTISFQAGYATGVFIFRSVFVLDNVADRVHDDTPVVVVGHRDLLVRQHAQVDRILQRGNVDAERGTVTVFQSMKLL